MLSDFFDDESVKNAKKMYYKRLLVRYGLFVAFVFFMMSALILLTKFSRASWHKGLHEKVQTVLSSSSGKDCSVGEYVMLGSAFSSSCAVFKLSSYGDKTHAVIVRMVTVYGSVPAVFVYGATSDSAEFVAFADVPAATAEKIRGISSTTQISYWEKRIPSIIKLGIGSGRKE